MTGQTVIGQGQLRIQEIYKDGLYYLEEYSVRKVVNAKIGRKCFKAYDDETVCDVVIVPVSVPSFVEVEYKKDYYLEEYQRYTVLYIYDGNKWSKAILDNYSWA